MKPKSTCQQPRPSPTSGGLAAGARPKPSRWAMSGSSSVLPCQSAGDCPAWLRLLAQLRPLRLCLYCAAQLCGFALEPDLIFCDVVFICFFFCSAVRLCPSPFTKKPRPSPPSWEWSSEGTTKGGLVSWQGREGDGEKRRSRKSRHETKLPTQKTTFHYANAVRKLSTTVGAD